MLWSSYNLGRAIGIVFSTKLRDFFARTGSERRGGDLFPLDRLCVRVRIGRGWTDDARDEIVPGQARHKLA
jgi:hypothetical protein